MRYLLKYYVVTSMWENIGVHFEQTANYLQKVWKTYGVKFVSKRITIIIDDEIIKKLHQRQANLIKKEKRTVTFSEILCGTIREGLD